MKFSLIYFGDDVQNNESFQSLLKESFLISAPTEHLQFAEVLTQKKPHGIILELDGFESYEKIISHKAYNGCPVFFTSKELSDETRMKSIEVGAIDFFHREMSVPELNIRIINKIKMFLQGSTVIDIGNLRIDSDKFTVAVNNKLVDLTMIETRILLCVIKAMPQATDKNELMYKLWSELNSKSKFNVHMSNMKLKLKGWDHELKIARSGIVQIKPV